MARFWDKRKSTWLCVWFEGVFKPAGGNKLPLFTLFCVKRNWWSDGWWLYSKRCYSVSLDKIVGGSEHDDAGNTVLNMMMQETWWFLDQSSFLLKLHRHPPGPDPSCRNNGSHWRDCCTSAFARPVTCAISRNIYQSHLAYIHCLFIWIQLPHLRFSFAII